jgi:hypothetical protein
MKRIFIILGLLIFVLNSYSQQDGEFDNLDVTNESRYKGVLIEDWINDSTPASSIAGDNGLTKTGSNIGLGGTLNANTEILGVGYPLTLGTNLSRLGDFIVQSIDTYISASGEFTLEVGGVEWVFDGTYFISDGGDTLMTNDLVDAKISASAPYLPFNYNYNYSTTITDSRPGVGYFRLNNPTYSNVTYIFIDNFDVNSTDKSDYLQQSDTGSYISISDGVNYVNFQLSGALTAASSYYKYGVTYLSHSGVLSGACKISMDLSNNVGGGGGADSLYHEYSSTWLANGDTIPTQDTSTYADTATYALNASTDSLFHEDTQTWLANGDTIPKSDSSRVLYTTDTVKNKTSAGLVLQSTSVIKGNSTNDIELTSTNGTITLNAENDSVKFISSTDVSYIVDGLFNTSDIVTENLNAFYIELNSDSPSGAKYIDSNSFYLGNSESIFSLNYADGSYPYAFYVQKKSPYDNSYGFFKIDGYGYNISATTNLTYPISQIIGNYTYTRMSSIFDATNSAEIEVNRNRTISLINTTSDEDNSMIFDQYSLTFNYDYDGLGNDTNYFIIDTTGVTFKDISKQTTALVTDTDTAFFDKSNGSTISHVKTNTTITNTLIMGADTATALADAQDVIPILDLDSLQVDKIVGSTNRDSISIGGNLYISADLIVYGKSFLNKYKAHAYIPFDSVATTSLSTTWAFLGGGTNNKFINDLSDGFTFDGDTLVFDQTSTDTRDSVQHVLNYDGISATNSVNETVFYGIFVKHVGGSYIEQPPFTKATTTSTAGVYYPGPICSGAVLWLKDGDKIHIRAKVLSGTTTLSTTSFGILLEEE